MNDFEFGNYLCALREKKGFTQGELAERLGVSNKAVSKWENGRSRPKSRIIVQLAALYGVSADDLLSGGRRIEPCDAVITSPLESAPARIVSRQRRSENMNLIPETSSACYDYMCTFANQRLPAQELGITGEGASELRDSLTDETLFGKRNYYHPFDGADRAALYLMVDDGWDVPMGTANLAGAPNLFGWCDPDPEKFPHYGRTPAERLKTLCEKTKALGYAGLGLWISPQMRFEDANAPSSLDEARKYWSERARWCHEAGISYWKIDWGVRCSEVDYRRMLTEVAREFAPGLIVEHAVCQPPFSQMGDVERRRALTKALLPYSDVFRLYDVIPPFLDSSMLARLDEALSAGAAAQYGAKGILNAEVCPEICAAMGCAAGVMSAPPTGGMMRACLRWHRIAPPYGIFGGVYRKSGDCLTDEFYFERDPADWVHVKGQTLTESAPAIMARDCALPVVKNGAMKPFICASRNPSGAYSIAAIKRTIDPNSGIIALADVTFSVGRASEPVGIFGLFRSLTLVYQEEIAGKRVLLQELLEDSAKDITDDCAIDGRQITIDGRLLRSDAPAFVVKVVGE